MFRDAMCVSLCRLLGVQVVTNYRGDVADAKAKQGRLSLSALRCIAKNSAWNVVFTDQSRDALVKIAGASCHVDKLPNFVDDSIFEIAPSEQHNGATKVIYVGGITREKGCDLIFDVARQAPHISFQLVGPAYPEAEGWLRSLPSNVCVCSEMTHAEVLRTMSAADILLFPSHSEGFPNVVAEAMALGVPVVATAVGAIPEMIGDGRGGITIPVGDREKALAAIYSLERDPAMRFTMGSFNRAKARRDYSYSVVVRDWVQLYDKILQREGGCETQSDRNVSGGRLD
jgi:glycosyltransferase involved in cell wall biosynthesis